MGKEIIIIGTSGAGKQAADVLLQAGEKIFGYLDDAYSEKEYLGFPILGSTDDYVRYLDKEFILAIGSASVRERLARKMDGVTWHTAIHPSAVISHLGTTIGEGCIICANTSIGPGATVGRHCIINTASVVGHDDKIGDFSHISPGAMVVGTVTLGRRTWIGVGATVKNNITICDDCIIGAGATVIRDITEKGTYVGLPAQKIK